MAIDPVKLSQKLVQQASISGQPDPGALDILQEALENIGFTCTRLPFAEEGTYDVDNLYARRGESGKNLCFAGHTDVVPVGDADGWDVDPFAAEIRDGVLIGRGAVDMKPAIAAWVAAAADVEVDGSISLLITGDEEADAINGTRKMLGWLEENGEQVDACIVGEPTNPEKLGEMVKIGRRGSITFDLTVNGKQGHVAYPAIADNPVPRLVNILHMLVNTSLDDGSEYFQPSNLEVTTIDIGNPASNVIPAKVFTRFNIRYNDHHNSAKLIKFVENICQQNARGYELKHRLTGESFLTEPGNLSDIVVSAVEEVSGIAPALSTTGGTSDARFIKDICPVVEFGLINKTAHKVNERVAVADILVLTEIYKQVILKFFEA